MSDLPKITPKDDGPLLVENPPALRDAAGAAVETKPVIALCRCGASKKKPFCDGSHAAIAFTSAPDGSALRNTPVEYQGLADGIDVTISYTPVLCTHAARCQALAGDVFDPKRKPWVHPADGSLAETLDVMAECPSGALRIGIGDSAPQHMTTGDVAIRIEKDGPYHITNVGLDADFNGAGASRAKYSLCRCGLSKNKPFCDGTHHDAKWSDKDAG